MNEHTPLTDINSLTHQEAAARYADDVAGVRTDKFDSSLVSGQLQEASLHLNEGFQPSEDSFVGSVSIDNGYTRVDEDRVSYSVGLKSSTTTEKHTVKSVVDNNKSRKEVDYPTRLSRPDELKVESDITHSKSIEQTKAQYSSPDSGQVHIFRTAESTDLKNRPDQYSFGITLTGDRAERARTILSNRAKRVILKHIVEVEEHNSKPETLEIRVQRFKDEALKVEEERKQTDFMTAKVLAEYDDPGSSVELDIETVENERMKNQAAKLLLNFYESQAPSHLGDRIEKIMDTIAEIAPDKARKLIDVAEKRRLELLLEEVVHAEGRSAVSTESANTIINQIESEGTQNKLEEVLADMAEDVRVRELYDQRYIDELRKSEIKKLNEEEI